MVNMKMTVVIVSFIKATTQKYMYLFMKEKCTVATVHVKRVSTGYQMVRQCTPKVRIPNVSSRPRKRS